MPTLNTAKLMLNLIYYELFKTYAKWRTYIGFIVVVALIPLVMWAMKVEGGKFIQTIRRSRTISSSPEIFLTGGLYRS